VLVAANGQHALERLREALLPDLIFLDLMMPVMDGAAFRTEQQRDPRLSEIPVVVMSAAADAEQQARRMGSDFVRKPVSLRVLVAAVGRHAPGHAPD
jgi:CheY-like chemotaxis protein